MDSRRVRMRLGCGFYVGRTSREVRTSCEVRTSHEVRTSREVVLWCTSCTFTAVFNLHHVGDR